MGSLDEKDGKISFIGYFTATDSRNGLIDCPSPAVKAVEIPRISGVLCIARSSPNDHTDDLMAIGLQRGRIHVNIRSDYISGFFERSI